MTATITRIAIPTVTPRVVRGKAVGSLIVDHCPYCNEPHYHGGGPADRDPGPYFGHRVSDCRHVGGYYLARPERVELK